jgi:hypothetical protein
MKKGNNSHMGNGIYFNIAELVDLDMLHISAVYQWKPNLV